MLWLGEPDSEYPRPRMRSYLLKLMKYGVPTGVVLAGVGYLFAHLAAIWYTSESGGRATVGAEEMSATLEWRLPLTMAAWGFGLVALFEGVLSLWRTPVASPAPAAVGPDETEQLLLKLLEEAEAAEDERRRRIELAQTPMPLKLAVPAPIAETHPPCPVCAD